jgi:isovaleryl-CoA dehydrogenase
MTLNAILNLKPEHETLADTVREFAKREIAPQYPDSNVSVEFNRQLFRELAGIDLLGATVPQEFRGAGMDTVASIIIHEEMAKADPGFTLSYLAHSLLFVHNLSVNGSDEQKRRYLDKVINGEWLAGMAMTEPEGGSDFFNMRTTAVRHGDNWILNGQKSFITNYDGDVFLVYAKTGDTSSVFIVESGYEGFSKGRSYSGKLGLKSSSWGDIHLDNCKVPAANLVGQVGDGKKSAFNILEIERLGLAAISYGIAQRCYDEMLQHSTRESSTRNRSIDHGLIGFYVASALGDIENGRPALYDFARFVDKQNASGQTQEDNRLRIMRANLIKANATPIAERIARNALQVQAAQGYAGEGYVAGRFLTDQFGISIGGGPLEVLYAYVAKQLANGRRI